MSGSRYWKRDLIFYPPSPQNKATYTWNICLYLCPTLWSVVSFIRKGFCFTPQPDPKEDALCSKTSDEYALILMVWISLSMRERSISGRRGAMLSERTVS